MQLLQEILSDTGLPTPDGRPLHDYSCSPETFAELGEALQSRGAAGRGIETAAAAFVFWAAEHIRARFPGGPLTWVFVFNGLGLPDNQQLGRELADQGLGWWGREIRVSDAGTRMSLYSLMAEGGIPEILLKEPGLYRGVVMGLLSEIEAEGGPAAGPWAEQIASRWTLRLPQTFQNADIARLLGTLALTLAKLRAMLPEDLPEAAAEQWLNRHRPGWTSDIPLRMTPEIAETLIRPALRAERDSHSVAARPLCGRELCRDETGCWRGYLILHDEGWLPARIFPGAEDLRLRLLPTGKGSIEGLIYSATPEGEGWRLRRFGKTGRAAGPFSPHEPFGLAAFADGRPKGEAIIDAGLLAPAEAPSFWRAVERNEEAEADQLVPLPGAARTKAPCLWLLAPNDVEPEVDAGLTLDEIETAADGFLWRISGKGTLRLGESRYRVETKADEDAPQARLFAFGNISRGWRLDGNTPVYLGEVTFYGQVGASVLRRVPEVELRRAPARSLGGEIVEWVQKDEILARFWLVRLPAAARFDLREDAPGRVTLTAEGLQRGWRLRLGAGEAEERGEAEDGNARLTLETPGMAPGIVQLRLSEPETGAALLLQAAWPARMGMIFDPQGAWLIQNQPISIEALHGWRAFVPEGARGDIQLQLMGHRAVSLPLAGEVSLASNMPSIRAMLAQGGPDAQVNLCLVVGGQESYRLEVRRYHDQAVMENGVLRAGFRRDERFWPETDLAAQLSKTRRLTIHAVNLNEPERIERIETGASVELGEHLADLGGPWVIQSRLESRVQRAIVWNPHAPPQSSRQDRVEAYVQEWRRMVSTPENTDWDRLWRLIVVVGQGGDAGVLDQVQALAQVPTAAICLVLRVRFRDLPDVLALDSASPIFWPALPVADFIEAIRIEHTRWLAKLLPYFDECDAETEADTVLVKRIGHLLSLRPELSGHCGKGLIEAGLFDRIGKSPDHLTALVPLLLPDPVERLTEVAQEAARRFDWLPQGVGGLEPLVRPAVLPSFGSHVQPVIDAPLVAAEMAAGHRPAPDAAEKLKLINLRLVDPIYFDAALPAALNLYLSELLR